MRLSALAAGRLRAGLLCLALLGGTAAAAGAQRSATDSTRRDTTGARLAVPSAALPPAPFFFDRRLAELRSALQGPDLTRQLLLRVPSLGNTLRVGFPSPGRPVPPPAPAAPPADTAQELTLALDARLESKAEQNRDETCSANPLFNLPSTCRSFFQPNFDFQFSVRSAGTVADRFRVDVDYDSQREFDASNQINIRYSGRPEHALQRVEVGNVTFTPPASRFITAGIPMGNYGVQAAGRIGGWELQAIAAQQRGNVVQERRFTVGGRSLQAVEREVDDYELEARRFFFTVDPQELGGGYPNVDILDAQQMAAARRRLPDERRPERVFVYRLIIGGRPANPNGPRFRLNGDPTSRPGPVYELLRENVDYYMDPSRLWLALVRPLGLYDERLVVAYTVRVNGVESVVPEIGGTPDVEFVAGRDQVANLVWEPRLEPEDPAFRREIRSVYRVGGPDVRRETVAVSVVTGAAGDQEKPADNVGDTYLERFGLAQRTNSATFDVDNRLWPRRADPNVVIGGGEAAPIIRDQFLVFPSLEPFARRGLAGAAGNPANDTLYRTPAEYLYSAQHPPSQYRIRIRYLTEGGDPGTIALGSVQLRQNSERVTYDGRVLRRGVDYEVDYDLGRLRFLRQSLTADGPHDVRVRFEENPLFVPVPTSVYGLTSQYTLPDGHLAFTAIAQRQKTVFTRPTLGFEPASSLVAGVSGAYSWNAEALTRFVDRLPGVSATAPSRVAVSGEFATSRPLRVASGQAYLESFEGDGGVLPPLVEGRWYFGSAPARSPALEQAVGPDVFTVERAATLAWQNVGRNAAGEVVTFSIEQIDPGARGAGGGVFLPEQMLWLTLHPLSVGGFFRDGQIGETFARWRIFDAPAGRRWRSLHTALGPTGADLTRVEAIEFWTLVDVAPDRGAENPLLVFDLGEVSENSLAFAPDTLLVTPLPDAAADTAYRGKRVQGSDSLDTELDPFSRTFNQSRDDTGLPGDVADRVRVIEPGRASDTTDVALCFRGTEQVFRLGDPRANCTVGNNRADTEDLDADDVLNLDRATLEKERIRRYVVDLGDPAQRARIGRCQVTVDQGTPTSPQRPRCWVQYRIPFNAPTDSLNGGPPLRRVQALRVTVVSGEGTPDQARIQLPLARLRFIGAPWLKRAERSVRGIAGDQPGQGVVTVTTIGTQDRDSLRGLFYESPPGVSDEPEQQQSGLEATRVQVNERSLRLQATSLEPWERAEAFVRFPEGEKSFLGYRELRVWARGRNSGWGPLGELQFYVKAGRDAENFYMYRTPVGSGPGRTAWEPEVRIDLRRFSTLRAQLQRLYLERPGGAVACTGLDSALVVNTPVTAGAGAARFAVCEDGYIVYTTSPTVNPPNLNAVQELAVGMLRVQRDGGAPVAPGDTIELWVNDLRLGRVENTPGYAGQLAVSLQASDVAELSLAVTRRDAYFRQLAELPGFRTDDAIEAAATVRLDKFFPQLGVALPVTVRTSVLDVDPLFVSDADYEGAGLPGLRTPRSVATTVSASIRRATPMGDSPWAPLLDNLALTASFTDADTRSEYQSGRARDVSTALEYRIAAEPRTLRVPGWFGDALGRMPQWLERATGVQALRAGEVRWNPAEVRVVSGVARTTDHRLTFLRNATSVLDPASAVAGENFVWRNAGEVRLEPVDGLTAALEMSSVRDLRDYGDSSVTGVTAGLAGSELLGTDVGFERERLLTGTLSWTPRRTGWLTPRVQVLTRFDLLRDPNRAPMVVGVDDALGSRLSALGYGPIGNDMLGYGMLDYGMLDRGSRAESREPRADSLLALLGIDEHRLELPRRLGNERRITTGMLLDFARLLGDRGDEGSVTRWLGGALQPLDVTYVRTLRSAYDALPFTPGFDFQLGLGGTSDFRLLRGLPASSAGLGTQVMAAQPITLPGGVNLVARFTRSRARNWTGQQLESDADGQRVDEGSQVSFPDLQLRWSWRPPAEQEGLVADANASARLLHTQQRNVALADADPSLRETRTARVRSYPVSGTITWGFGRLTTAGGYAVTLRTDTIPGTRLETVTRDASGEISRPFTLPASWGLRSDLRTRLGYQYARSYSTAASLDDASRNSRLVDNGRWALSFDAESDVAENLTLVLQGSRIVTFDENLNRRFTQTVLTAALQLSFFAGPM